ncbi:hypothetical protein QFZ63_001226 [Streptomyces sp. B3I7]|nr:hypothetical protein [Streptomyces sp. B3I7]
MRRAEGRMDGWFADTCCSTRTFPRGSPCGPGTVSLVGPIGRAVLGGLLPEHRRQRLKARYRKSASKYGFQRDQYPRTVQAYTLDFKNGQGRRH